MGWTEAPARHFKADGTVDVKAEMDDLYSFEGERSSNQVIASSMVGSTYYAAVRRTDRETGEETVWAGVARTGRPLDRSFDIGYKDMDETCGPLECDCPKKILDLLSPTESEFALDWRRRCLESADRRAFARSVLREQPGTKVMWRAPDGLSQYAPGELVELTVARVRGTRALVDMGRMIRVPTKYLSRDNAIVTGRPSNERLPSTSHATDRGHGPREASRGGEAR